MKKFVVAILIFCGGVLAANFYQVLSAYFRLPGVWKQGEGIVSGLDGYKEATGKFPEHDWFLESFPDTITSEGRKWHYVNIPPIDPAGETLLIVTRVDYGDSYFGVYSGGEVRNVDFAQIIQKN